MDALKAFAREWNLDHGVPTSPHFVAWFFIVPAVYLFLFGSFRALNLWPGKTRFGSRGSDIMAYELTALMCVTYLTFWGSIAFFDLMPGKFDYNNVYNDQFYAKSIFVEDYLLAPVLSYQGWLLLLSFIENDLRDVAMIGHHVATFAVGYFCLYPYCHGYSLFFVGIVEFTNVPLTFVDIFKYFPDLKEKFSAVNEVSRIIFAIAFIIIRLIMWPYIGITKFWVGSVDLVKTGNAHSNFVVIFVLAANLFLTGLQFLWGYKIFGFLLPKKASSKKQK